MKTINKIPSKKSINLKDEITNNLSSQLYTRQKELDETNVIYQSKKKNLEIKTNNYKEFLQSIKTLEFKIEEENNKFNPLKIKHKLILKSINQDFLNEFKGNSNKIINEIFLTFINFNNEQVNQLNYLLENKDELKFLLYNSFQYYKLLIDNNTIDYNNKKRIILSSINKFRKLIDNPFERIMTFIENSFKILDLKIEIKKDNNKLIEINAQKNKIFSEIQTLRKEISNMEIDIKKLYDYNQQISYIIQDYKKIFSANNSYEIKNEKITSIKNLIEILKQNELYKKPIKNKILKKNIKKQKGTNLSTPRNERQVKQISSISFQNFKNEMEKLTKVSKSKYNQTININYRVNNKINNISNTIINNGIISTDISESEKTKKPFYTISKLISKSTLNQKKEKMNTIKKVYINNNYKLKSNQFYNNENKPKNQIIKIKRIEVLRFNDSIEPISYTNDDDIDNNSDYSIGDEFEVQNNKEKKLKESKSLSSFRTIHYNMKYNQNFTQISKFNEENKL